MAVKMTAQALETNSTANNAKQNGPQVTVSAEAAMVAGSDRHPRGPSLLSSARVPLSVVLGTTGRVRPGPGGLH